MRNITILFITLILGSILITAGCGREQPSQESQFADLPEYNLEEVQVLADQGDLILGQPVYTEIDSDGVLTFESGAALKNAVTDHIYVGGEAEDGAPVIFKYRIITNDA